MNRIGPAAILVLLATLALPTSARAQCAEGMTASGECVDPGLAAGARQGAIIFSQPKISYTAYPVLPNGGFTYRYPNNLILDPLTAVAPRGSPCVSTLRRPC